MTPARLLGIILGVTGLMVAYLAIKSNQPIPAPEPKVANAFKERTEATPIKVERTQQISDSESVKVILVPEFPSWQRCVVYTNATSSTMQCTDAIPEQ